MKFFCERIALWCQRNGAIEKDQYEIVVYGLQLMGDTSIKLLGLLLIGCLFGCVREILITFVAFGSMRYWCGGYHCKTNTGCFWAMFFICFSPIVISKAAVPYPILIWTAMMLYCCWMVYRYAPRNSRVNPITSQKTLKRKRMGSLLWLAVELLLAVVCGSDVIRWLIMLPLFIEACTISPIFYRNWVSRFI